MATKTIVGEKVGMTQVWDENNNVVPVTVLSVTPVRVVQIKTPETDGYSALQVTYGSKDPRKVTQPVLGHYDKAGVDPGVVPPDCVLGRPIAGRGSGRADEVKR